MPESSLNEIGALSKLSVGELHARYVQVFGEESRCRNRDYLWKRIAWRIQELNEGGLSDRVREKARALARDVDLRVVPPRPIRGVPLVGMTTPKNGRPPRTGVTLTRELRGRTYSVAVLAEGFEYEGQYFKSLSAVARYITGTRWNGWAFFGLAPKKEKAR